MKKISKKILLFSLLAIILLSSCTHTKQCNVPEFTSRFNQKAANEILKNENYRVTDNVNYSNFINLKSGRKALISLKIREDSTVFYAAVTVTKSEQELTDSEREEIFAYYKVICTVLSDCEEEKTNGIFAENSFTQNFLSFGERELKIEDENELYFMMCNKEIISLSLEIKNTY